MGFSVTVTAPPGGTNEGPSSGGALMHPPISVSTATAETVHRVRDITPLRCLTHHPAPRVRLQGHRTCPQCEGWGLWPGRAILSRANPRRGVPLEAGKRGEDVCHCLAA